jgi:hypothetical protein
MSFTDQHLRPKPDDRALPLPVPSFDDPISPADVAEAKLTELHNFAEQYKLTLNIPVREREMHHEEAGKLKMQIGHLKGGTSRYVYGPDISDRDEEKLQEKIKEMGAQIDKHEWAEKNLAIRIAELADIHAQQMNVWHSCRQWWFNNLKVARVAPRHTISPHLGTIAGLTDLRVQISQTKQQLKDLKWTMMPMDEVRTLAEDYVALEAKKVPLKVQIAKGKLFVTTVVASPFSWMCAFVPEQMVSAILAQAQQAPGIVMPSGEREATRTRLEAQLLMLERDEESLIETLHIEGNMAHRRTDADPRAILGLEIHSPTAGATSLSRGKSDQPAEAL